jgi:hypothetical protein
MTRIYTANYYGMYVLVETDVVTCVSAPWQAYQPVNHQVRNSQLVCVRRVMAKSLDQFLVDVYGRVVLTCNKHINIIRPVHSCGSYERARSILLDPPTIPASTLPTNVRYTGHTQKNGAVSKVIKKFIPHSTRAQHTPSAAGTVHSSHALPAVHFLCSLRGRRTSF